MKYVSLQKRLLLEGFISKKMLSSALISEIMAYYFWQMANVPFPPIFFDFLDPKFPTGFDGAIAGLPDF